MVPDEQEAGYAAPTIGNRLNVRAFSRRGQKSAFLNARHADALRDDLRCFHGAAERAAENDFRSGGILTKLFSHGAGLAPAVGAERAVGIGRSFGSDGFGVGVPHEPKTLHGRILVHSPTMRWLDRLERRFGEWAIPQFPLFIVAANGMIYLLTLTNPLLYSKLVLNVDAVRAGEVWRLVTFLFVPPMYGPISMAFGLALIYYYGLALERAWGEFKFCFYYLAGGLATVLTAFFIVGETLPNIPLNTSIFLAFATLFPNFEVSFFYLFSFPVKYLAYLIWAATAYELLFGGTLLRAAVGASLFNFVIFFGPELMDGLRLRWQVYRNRRRFRGEA
jgi:hypothetical protein